MSKYIDTKKFMQIISEKASPIIVGHNNAEIGMSVYGIMQAIETCSTPDDKKQEYAEWQCSNDILEEGICSACGTYSNQPYVYVKQNFKFCPFCGSKMS